MKNFGAYGKWFEWGCVGNKKNLLVYQFLILGWKNFGEYKPYIEMMSHNANDVA